MPTPYRQQTPATRLHTRLKSPYLLFILPLPLLWVIAIGLASGQFSQFFVGTICLILFWSSAWFIKISNRYSHAQQQRKWARRTRVPWRLLATMGVATGCFLGAWLLVPQNQLISLGYSALGAVGVLMRYGVDPQYDRSKDVALVGVTVEELIDIFEEAEGYISSLEISAKNVKNIDFKAPLNRIAHGSREILDMIEDDPADLRKARKFLKTYLRGASQVADKFANNKNLSEEKLLEQNFRETLITIENVTQKQKNVLLKNDVLDLDVQIEVLHNQLKYEGLSS
jgi:5-bromo-4-chloroindolyl phosphate hydrolysis protein